MCDKPDHATFYSNVGTLRLWTGIAVEAVCRACACPSRNLEDKILSNVDYRGPAQELLEGTNSSAWARDCSFIGCQRMWLPFALVLRICLKLNWKVLY